MVWIIKPANNIIFLAKNKIILDITSESVKMNNTDSSLSLSSYKLIADPNQTYQISHASSMIHKANFTNFSGYQETYLQNGFQLYINIFMRECRLGERYLIEHNICEMCDSGTFALSLDALECQTCPIGARCFNGSMMELKPGFWREGVLSNC